MADVEEDDTESVAIKLEFEPDDEDFVLYNIHDKAEEIIFDRNNDPLLSLNPIIYTTKLDDMKIFKEDLTNLTANQVLNKLESESRPILRTESIQRSSYPPNVESFVEVTNVLDYINFKTNYNIPSIDEISGTIKQVHIEETNSSSALSFEINGVANDIHLKSNHDIPSNIITSPTLDTYLENKKEIYKCANSRNIAPLNEITGVVNDINLKTLKTNNLLASNGEKAQILYAHIENKKEYIEHTMDSENMLAINVTTPASSNMYYEENPQAHNKYATAVKSEVHSCADFNANKEYRACYVVLQDIKNLLLGNHKVKVDSHGKIISEVQVKVEVKETQILDCEHDSVEPVSSKIVLGQIKKTNVTKTSVTETNEAIRTNELHSEELDEQNKEFENPGTNNNNTKNIYSGRLKRKRKRRIIYVGDDDASSDEDYTPIKDIKRSKNYKVKSFVNYKFSHSDSDSISNNAANTVSKVEKFHVSKTAQNKVSKTSQDNVSKENVSRTTHTNVSKTPQNNVSKENVSRTTHTNVSKTPHNTVSNSNSNASNVIIVSHDIGLPSFQEKYGLIVLMSQNGLASIYRLNPSKLITDCYVTKDYDEYKLASMYPKEEKIIEQYCCWFNREEIIRKICLRKNYSFTIMKYLKNPHPCHPEECRCCCQVINTDTNQTKHNEKRALVHKCITVANEWIRELLDKSKCSPDGLVGKALTYNPKGIKEKSEQNKPEKYLENYLLCLRYSGPNKTHELYEIGQKGNVVRSLLLNNEEEVLRIKKKYQQMSMPVRDAQLCCWYKREKLMHELKMLKTSPAALKHLQKAHICNYKTCVCCCKPLPITLNGAETPLSVFKHTTAYNKDVRSMVIKFNAKSKNAMSRAKANCYKSKRTTINTDASTAAVVLSGCDSKNDNPDLSVNMLSKFKNLKLGVDSYGKLEIILNSPAKNLSVAELKVLSDIMALSSKQLDELGLSAEEFCKRINTKSGNIINVITPETTLITTEEKVAAPMQGQFENDEIADFADKNTNKDDDVISISSNQSTIPSESEKASSNLQSQTEPIELPRKTITRMPSLKTNTTKSVSNMFTTLANLMETKTKCYVDSFKSFFNKSDSSYIVVPNINKFTPVSKTVATFESTTVDHLPLPIIKETFTLAKSPATIAMEVPGPSGVNRQYGMKIPETVPIDRYENNNQALLSNSPNKTFKHKLENVINFQIDKKIRVKPPSELNAPVFQEKSVSDNSQTRPVSTWPASVGIKPESQTNMQHIVGPVGSTAITISPTMQNQAYVVTQNISLSPNMKIVSPTSLGVNKVIRINRQPTGVNGVRYLTIGPIKGSKTVEKNKATLTKMLKAPQAQPTATSSGRYYVPPLVPIRPANAVPVAAMDESSGTQDLENSITFNVIQTTK